MTAAVGHQVGAGKPDQFWVSPCCPRWTANKARFVVQSVATAAMAVVDSVLVNDDVGFIHPHDRGM